MLAGALATAIAAENKWLLLIAGYLFWRIFKLRQRKVLLISTLVAVGLALLTGYFIHWVGAHTLRNVQAGTWRIVVYPDEVRHNGSLVFFTAHYPGARQKDTAMVRARTPEELSRFTRSKLPTVWQVTGDRQPIIPATNDNQFDTQRYYNQRRICNELRIKEVKTIRPLRRYNIAVSCHVIRRQLITFFNRMPRPLAGYCQQLIIGEQTQDNGELMENAKRLGIIHLFCISGMHVVLLVTLVRMAANYLWLDLELVNWCLLFFLPAYLIIGGGSVSLIRAVIMMELILGHRILKIDALDGWAISLLIGMAWNPYLLLNLGGQLTYLLSLVLHVINPQIGNFKRCWWLSLVSLPSILANVYEVHWLSFFASFVMIPFFSVVIFPLVMVSAVTYDCVPLVGQFANEVLIFFQHSLSTVGQIPGMIPFGKPPLFWSLTFFILTLWLLERPSFKKYGYLLVAYLVCFTAIHLPLTGEVTFVDIGQGDSILVRTPLNRRVMLIDTGGKLNFKQPQWARVTVHSDGAKRATINYLKSRGITTIDTIYLSHHDADHIGYLPTFLKEMRVCKIAVPAGMEDQTQLIKRLNDGHFTGQLRGVTDRNQVDPELRILHPFNRGDGKNEDSMALTGNFGGQSFIFTGDLDRQGERAILQRYPGLRTDVLKLGHHGSRTASDPQFLDAIRPQIGIISAGRFNRYHHPNDDVVEELKCRNIKPLSTQQYGMIKYNYRGQSGKWQTKLRGDEIKWTLPSSLSN